MYGADPTSIEKCVNVSVWYYVWVRLFYIVDNLHYDVNVVYYVCFALVVTIVVNDANYWVENL